MLQKKNCLFVKIYATKFRYLRNIGLILKILAKKGQTFLSTIRTTLVKYKCTNIVSIFQGNIAKIRKDKSQI